MQEYVTDLLENDEKFLIFAHHKDLLDGVEQRLRSKKVRFIRIDGATAAHERQVGPPRKSNQSKRNWALLYEHKGDIYFRKGRDRPFLQGLGNSA